MAYFHSYGFKFTCMRDLEEFFIIAVARYSRTFSRVSTFLSRVRKTSAKPSYKMFMTVLIVVNDDNKSAGLRVDDSEKHCWLLNCKIKNKLENEQPYWL